MLSPLLVWNLLLACITYSIKINFIFLASKKLFTDKQTFFLNSCKIYLFIFELILLQGSRNVRTKSDISKSSLFIKLIYIFVYLSIIVGYYCGAAE